MVILFSTALLTPLQLALRPLQMALRPLRLALTPLLLALTPHWLALRPLLLVLSYLRPRKLVPDPCSWPLEFFGRVMDG